MTREQHLAWCKKRALEYVERGDFASAVASMGSDLAKHPETLGIATHHNLMLAGTLYAMKGQRQLVRDWIEGFR